MKQRLKKFMATKPALQKILKVILCPVKEDKCNHENTGKKKISLDEQISK
jgi:hypothetical protein